MDEFVKEKLAEWNLSSLNDIFEGKVCFDYCDAERFDLFSLKYVRLS